MSTEDPALHLLDLSRMRGLEIGPLSRPRVAKSQGQVFYVDHFTTEQLRENYRANSLMRPHIDEIVEVDYVIKDGLTLSEAIGDDGPFDYVIASHVLEHLANPVGWLQDLEKVLGDDGLVSLVVPDKRFCFDINRAETRPQDWVDWYMRDLRAPSFGQLFDFFAHVTTIDGMVDTFGLWAGRADYTGVRRSDVADADAAALAICRQHQESGAYIDVHAGVYTPSSLLSLLELAIKLGLVNFEVAHFEPTRRNSLEFHVTLRACRQREQALASVAQAREALATADVPDEWTAASQPAPPEGEAIPSDGLQPLGATRDAVATQGSNGGSLLEVSKLERQMIELKRSVLWKVRRFLHGQAS